MYNREEGGCWGTNQSLKRPRLLGAINLSEIDGAGDAIRTRDIFLGKEVLYH